MAGAAITSRLRIGRRQSCRMRRMIEALSRCARRSARRDKGGCYRAPAMWINEGSPASALSVFWHEMPTRQGRETNHDQYHQDIHRHTRLGGRRIARGMRFRSLYPARRRFDKYAARNLCTEFRRRSRCPKTSRLRQARRSIGSPVIGAGPARNGLGLRAITSNGPTKLRSGIPVIGSRAAAAIAGSMDAGDKSAVTSSA